MVYAYDAGSQARVPLAGPVATGHRRRRRGLLGALRRRGGDVCGPGCWPTKGGGCDCGGTYRMRSLRGLGGPLISDQAKTTLLVLTTLAIGATVYSKLHGRR